MTPSTAVPEPRDVPVRALAPFLLITFGLAWSILGFYVFLPGPMDLPYSPNPPRKPFRGLDGRQPPRQLA